MRHRIPLLLALAGLAFALVWLVTRGFPGEERHLEEPVAKGGAAVADHSVERSESRSAASTAEPASTTPAEDHDPPDAEVLSGGTAPPDQAPDEFLVRGRIRFPVGEPLQPVGDWFWPALSGRVRAVDSSGAEKIDWIEEDGSFEIDDLEPGTWVIVTELEFGRAEAIIHLTDVAPEATVELVLDRSVAVALRVRFPRAAGDVAPGHRGSTIVVAHQPADGGRRSSLASLETVAMATLPGNWCPSADELAGTLFLRRDEELTLSLFVNELWIACRTREPGQSRVEWKLTPQEWPPNSSRLEVTVIDGETGAPLAMEVKTPGWRGKRLESTQFGTNIFEQVPAGWREVEVGEGRYEKVNRSIWVGPGETVRETMVLHRGVIIAGTVTGPKGRFWSTTLGAWRVDPERGRVDPRTLRTTWCRTGRGFAFPSMSPGTYLIRALYEDESFHYSTGDERYSSPFVEVEALSDRKDVRIELVLVSTLVLARTQLVDGPLSWRLEDPEGRQVRQGQLTSSAPLPVSLAVGSYRLVVEGGEQEARTWSLELGTETQRIEL